MGVVERLVGVMMAFAAFESFRRDAAPMGWLFAAVAVLLFQMANRVSERAMFQQTVADLSRRLASLETATPTAPVYRSGFPL